MQQDSTSDIIIIKIYDSFIINPAGVFQDNASKTYCSLKEKNANHFSIIHVIFMYLDSCKCYSRQVQRITLSSVKHGISISLYMLEESCLNKTHGCKLQEVHSMAQFLWKQQTSVCAAALTSIGRGCIGKFFMIDVWLCFYICWKPARVAETTHSDVWGTNKIIIVINCSAK